MAMLKDIGGLLALTGRLLARFWPQLLLIGTLGYIARDLLLDAAVSAGGYFPLAGMIVLSLVVLVKLLVVVTMFATLRPGLPELGSLRQTAADGAASAPDNRRSDRMLMVTAAVILPFFAYYAAWGFLGDTVREYSRLAFERTAFGEKMHIFDLMRSGSLIAAIVVCWLIRWLAKRANEKIHSPWLRLLIVAADASWIFIGLFALDKWKDDLIRWIGAGALLDGFEVSAAWLSMSAYAAENFVPVEFQQPGLWVQTQNLFFYALLPMVWLVMAAIIYGYDLSAKKAPVPPAPSRGTTFRKWLLDFTAHYLGGYRSRYRPVWTCLKLVAGTGLGTLLSFIVLYRAISWLGAWIWYGTTHYLGPYDIEIWQHIANVLVIFIGSPSELDGGILLDAIRVALLAAVLEHALASQKSRAISEPDAPAVSRAW
ncbi:hypothetical protein AVM02_01305 [Brucella anthropi]|uniref:hypothetical protein n=1 Tax=Brucella anthropi TaxID=529 RepID=UPI00398647B1